MINKNVANAVTNPQTEEPANGGKVLRERLRKSPFSMRVAVAWGRNYPYRILPGRFLTI